MEIFAYKWNIHERSDGTTKVLVYDGLIIGIDLTFGFEFRLNQDELFVRSGLFFVESKEYKKNEKNIVY